MFKHKENCVVSKCQMKHLAQLHLWICPLITLVIHSFHKWQDTRLLFEMVHHYYPGDPLNMSTPPAKYAA